MPAHAIERVAVDQVPAEQRQVIDALLQLYLHDFSEYAPLGTAYGEVGEDGRFAFSSLDTYWQEPGRVPFLIRADDRIAGFVLVNGVSALDQPVDYRVVEFFVLRKYRRASVGTRVARRVFERMRGRWEVPVAFYNHGAIQFWRAVARGLPVHVVEREGDGQRWQGPVLCFDMDTP